MSNPSCLTEREEPGADTFFRDESGRRLYALRGVANLPGRALRPAQLIAANSSRSRPGVEEWVKFLYPILRATDPDVDIFEDEVEEPERVTRATNEERARKRADWLNARLAFARRAVYEQYLFYEQSRFLGSDLASLQQKCRQLSQAGASEETVKLFRDARANQPSSSSQSSRPAQGGNHNKKGNNNKKGNPKKKGRAFSRPNSKEERGKLSRHSVHTQPLRSISAREVPPRLVGRVLRDLVVEEARGEHGSSDRLTRAWGPSGADLQRGTRGARK